MQHSSEIIILITRPAGLVELYAIVRIMSNNKHETCVLLKKTMMKYNEFSILPEKLRILC